MTASEDLGTIPGFRLAASTGQTLAWESFAGKMPVWLVFLPSIEAADDDGLISAISSRLVDFGRSRSQVLVVAKTTARQARELAESKSWNVPILADASGAMMRDFGVADSDGRVRRTAVLADKEGAVIRRIDPLTLGEAGSPDEIVTDLLASLRSP